MPNTNFFDHFLFPPHRLSDELKNELTTKEKISLSGKDLLEAEMIGEDFKKEMQENIF